MPSICLVILLLLLPFPVTGNPADGRNLTDSPLAMTPETSGASNSCDIIERSSSSQLYAPPSALSKTTSFLNQIVNWFRPGRRGNEESNPEAKTDAVNGSPHFSVTLNNITENDRKKGNLYLKHFNVYVNSINRQKSLTDGVTLYMLERLSGLHGQKTFNNTELDGLFHADSLKETHRRSNSKIIRANDLRQYEIEFYTKFANKKAPLLNPGFKLAPLKNGSTNSCRKIINPDNSVFYFKRLPDEKDKLQNPLIGKKIAAEVAAYRLNQLLGFELVPETSLILMNKQLGSYQKSVPESYKNPILNPQGDTGQLLLPEFSDSNSEFEVFNFIGSIQDRHNENIFVDEKSHKIMTIDNDSGFHFVIPPVSGGGKFHQLGKLPSKYTPRTIERIESLQFKDVKESFKDLLPIDQINAIWLRIDILRADINQRKNSNAETRQSL